MIVCYLELYEEGEVDHINGPTQPARVYIIWLAIKGQIYDGMSGIYGYWGACVHYHVYPKKVIFLARPRAVEFEKLGQTPLICSTSPSSYNFK